MSPWKPGSKFAQIQICCRILQDEDRSEFLVSKQLTAMWYSVPPCLFTGLYVVRIGLQDDEALQQRRERQVLLRGQLRALARADQHWRRVRLEACAQHSTRFVGWALRNEARTRHVVLARRLLPPLSDQHQQRVRTEFGCPMRRRINSSWKHSRVPERLSKYRVDSGLRTGGNRLNTTRTYLSTIMRIYLQNSIQRNPEAPLKVKR